MSSFFTSGFASKRKVPRRGTSSTPGEKDTGTAKAGKVAGDSWVMLHDHEGRPVWWNSNSGDWIYYSTPVPQSFNNLVALSPGLSAQPLITPVYSPYVGNVGLCGAAPQLLTIASPPTSVIMPPAVAVPPVKGKKKSSGKHNVWEKFYDEEGRAVWIHADTGKRTRKDPYV